jgi:chitinase
MKKRCFLLAFMLVITFTVGYFTGVFFPVRNTVQKEKPFLSSAKSIKMVQKSAKKPIPKHLPEKNKQPKVVVGYIQDFRNPDMVDYEKLTYLNFSFAHPTKDGGLLLNGQPAWDNLRSMVIKAHQQGTKIMLAVGGWYHIQGGESYNYFKPSITDPGSRSKLVAELVNVADKEKLDGIDIDFEHPRSQADAQNLMIFIKELSERLHHNGKELSMAVQSKINGDTLTEAKYVVYEAPMFQYVDHVNIMAYDGQWDGKYNAANLSPYPFAEKIVNYWSDLFKANNLSLEKLVLGVPCYAQPENANDKQVSYAEIVKNNPTNADKDIVNLNGKTYYYNGTATIERKTKLALEHGFGGMMLWEEGLDAVSPYSLTAAISNTLNKSVEVSQK